ncbi:hypothetical protein AAFF_G00262250 [Aldrovandia affinis]|uniref:Uncharacterized protein n=1 Tax=Aldrovandia affinis TaxID=143900 RepID=A0AAD7WSU8_9TELE|nr:hypothetical protein AAFF_G00262250 [Aldrovandia affinis]
MGELLHCPGCRGDAVRADGDFTESQPTVLADTQRSNGRPRDPCARAATYRAGLGLSAARVTPAGTRSTWGTNHQCDEQGPAEREEEVAPACKADTAVTDCSFPASSACPLVSAHPHGAVSA